MQKSVFLPLQASPSHTFFSQILLQPSLPQLPAPDSRHIRISLSYRVAWLFRYWWHSCRWCTGCDYGSSATYVLYEVVSSYQLVLVLLHPSKDISGNPLDLLESRRGRDIKVREIGYVLHEEVIQPFRLFYVVFACSDAACLQTHLGCHYDGAHVYILFTKHNFRD